MKSFFDTNRDYDLGTSKKKALAQQEIILDFFKRNPERIFTPFEIIKLLFNENTPVTSIRRAMSNLTDEGYLEKLNQFKIEVYGKRNHYWRLRQPETMQMSFI